ncbi:MAG: ABC transporter permease, partial [Candidatus Hydrogenedentes bacterium]|nr:ABC transporter permease [Candidatus Hydrogenedentota bacterium]
MKKTLGIFGLLVVVCAFTAINSPNFLSAYNMQNTFRWTGLYGVIGVGAALVIITGGIDLSIGAVVGLV